MSLTRFGSEEKNKLKSSEINGIAIIIVVKNGTQQIALLGNYLDKFVRKCEKITNNQWNKFFQVTNSYSSCFKSICSSNHGFNLAQISFDVFPLNSFKIPFDL